MTPEDILLAMVRFRDLPLGEKLVQSGIDVGRLEQAVREARSNQRIVAVFGGARRLLLVLVIHAIAH